MIATRADRDAGRPPITAGRLVGLAMLAGALATVLLVVVAAAGDDRESEGTGDAGWVFGLLLLAAPFLAPALVRTVVASTLLRPIGGSAAAVATFAAAVHVALSVESLGLTGWLTAAPAIAVPFLLLAAVRRRPAGRTEPARPDPPSTPDPAVAGGDGDQPSGPPLPISGALAAARRHAGRAVLAWALVLVVGAVAAGPMLDGLGWPSVDATLEAEVAAVSPAGERTAVTFEAPHHGRTLSWTVVRDDPAWTEGDRLTAYLDDEGRVHLDQQAGLAGAPLIVPLGLVGVFALFALRRLWGLAVAHWDAHHGEDAPRPAYAAIIDDPAPRTWRPLLAVWSSDPTGGDRLARPDAVYRADHATSDDLQCSSSEVVVRRAWIDSGFWAAAKPRWVGVEDGVAVPHRRSLLGSRYVHAITRRSDVAPVVPLRHGPPDAGAAASAPGPATEPVLGGLAGMVAWRLLVLLAGIAFAFATEDHGSPARLGEVVAWAPILH